MRLLLANANSPREHCRPLGRTESCTGDELHNRWQEAPLGGTIRAILLRSAQYVGGSPGVSRGPRICLTRPISTADGTAIIATAPCAEKAGASTRWVVFVPIVAGWEAPTTRNAAVPSVMLPAPPTTRPVAALNAVKLANVLRLQFFTGG